MSDLRGKLISADEAVPSGEQHQEPCSDCPWRRDALPGWLGSMSVEEWLTAAHGEARIDCHTFVGPQCAGSAIYRRNVCKRPRDPDVLVLPADRDTVFANPKQFAEHHSEGN